MNTIIAKHIQKMDPTTRILLKPYFAHPSADEWVRDVLATYCAYFLSVGEDEAVNRAAKQTLTSALKALVPAGNRRTLDQIEDFLSAAFRQRGFFFLGGMTGPYYGPYIWKRTEKRMFDVVLPGAHVHVNVFFMHDFLMRSWMHFQTFGAHGTGGWAKNNESPWEDGLYCVAAEYDLDHLDQDPVFQVSLLKHEAQHYADKAACPGMSSTELEYRAKLVELIYYPEMRYRLAAIIREAAPNNTDPHRRSAHRILRELSKNILHMPYVKDEKAWRSVSYDKIQAEAERLFKEDTRQLCDSKIA